jgi:outer membrane protein TolC
MKKLFILLMIFELGVSLPNVFSQEKATHQTLTLEECIQLALRNRPELEMATLDVLNAEHQIKEAHSYYFPRLNFSTGYSHFGKPPTFDADVDISEISGPVNILLGPYGLEIPYVLQERFVVGKRDWYYVSLDLNQPLYTFGRIKEGVKQAQLGHSITLNQKEKKRREIVYEVKKGYYQFLFAKEIHQLIREAETRANVVVGMVKIGYETSVPDKEEKGTTRISYLKAKNFHSELKTKLSEVNKNLRLAELAIKMTVGIHTDSPLTVVEIPLESIPMPRYDMEETKGRTRERNIDLKNLDLGVQLSDARRRMAKKEYFPKIGLQGQYVGPEDRYGQEHFWYLGVGLTMPLFDGFLTRAKVGQAEAQFQKIKSQKMQLESALTVQVEHLHSTLKELQEKAQILGTAIKEAHERTQLAADGYAVGVTDYDELLLAQRTELEMKSAYLQSLYLYQVTLSEIELITGN